MRRFLIAAVMAALFASAAAPGPAAAGTHQIPVNAAIVAGEELSAGESSWTSIGKCGGVWSVRMATARQWWAGDAYLQGEALVTYNMSLIFGCDGLQSGRLWGSTTWEPDAYPGSSWQGSFDFLVTSEDEFALSYTGPLHAKGSGDLAGYSLNLRGTSDGTIPAETVEGFVLVPGGK